MSGGGDTSSGVSAMVKCACWCDRRLGLDVEAIGRGAFDRKDTCKLEMCGAHLAYEILIDGGWINLSVQPMDSGESSERLLTIAGGDAGWDTISRLLEAFEHSGIKSLYPSPLHVGSESGPNAFVIS
jgi:hypothetical protein